MSTSRDKDDPNPPDMFQSSISAADRARILAYGMPLLSPAAGGRNINLPSQGSEIREVNMSGNSERPNGWWRPGEGDLDNRWLHSDLKQVAYYYVYPLFVNLVETGGLK